MLLEILLAVTCFSSEGLSNSIKPCKLEDSECTVQEIIPKVLSGIPSIGMEPLDPIFVEEIEGNLSILKFKFINYTMTGLKNCEIKNLKIDEQLKGLHYELHCPFIKGAGQYEIDGRLIVLPVQGKGDSTIETGKYIVTIDAELKTAEGSDGKTHLSIKNFKLKCQALSAIIFDFKNLFNGRKDLSDAIHDFAHQNWKEVAELVQDPVWYGLIKQVFSNINKYLKKVPVNVML